MSRFTQLFSFENHRSLQILAIRKKGGTDFFISKQNHKLRHSIFYEKYYFRGVSVYLALLDKFNCVENWEKSCLIITSENEFEDWKLMGSLSLNKGKYFRFKSSSHSKQKTKYT